MVKFERTYEDVGVINSLQTVLQELGATIEIEGCTNFTKGEPIYFFNSELEEYILKEGVIVARFPEKVQGEKRYGFSWKIKKITNLMGNLVNFEVKHDYSKKIEITASGSNEYAEQIKEILNKIKIDKRPDKEKQRFKWEFTDMQKTSENLFMALDENGVRYRIKPRLNSNHPEYSHNANGGDYLIRGMVEIEGKDISLELEPHSLGGLFIYAVSSLEDREFIQIILEKIEPERVELEKTITRFGGKEVKISGYRWENVGGLESMIEELKETIEWPLKNYELFSHLGIRMSKGILLHGPPGNGKTLLAKIIATESGAYFFQASAVELTSMWHGNSEKLVRGLFDHAREYKPSIIFIDEIDALFTKRNERMSEVTRRMLGVFLQELDGFEDLKGTVVLATTNKYDDLDPAILRPGRFDRIIKIPLPDFQGREKIFQIHTRKMPIVTVDFDKLTGMTEGYSGADIESVCQRAGYNALRKYMKEKNVKVEDIKDVLIKELNITQEDFEGALEKVILSKTQSSEFLQSS